MRVLVAHSRYLSGSSSGENRVVDDECALLRKGGHNINEWTPSLDGKENLVAAGIKATWSRGAYAELRSRIREQGSDIVHLHNLFPALSPAAISAALHEDVPVVMSLHNFRLSCLAGTFLRNEQICEVCKGRPPLRGVLHGCYRGSRLASGALATSLIVHRARGTFKHIDTFLAVSEFVRQKYVEAGFEPSRITVKPNFAPPSDSRVGPGDHFLYMGRLSPEKGVVQLVKNWPSDQRARLVVAGTGPDRERAAALSGSNISFLGELGADALGEVVRTARAVVVPSICYEGAPRAVLEAFAAGVPVIANRIGALAEMVRDEKNGFLVDSRGSTMHLAVDQLLDDDVSIRLGQEARATWADEFAPQGVLTRLESIYDSVISARSGLVGARGGP
jgi:glycosyltransferase involved in cell wall biosynthesis